LSGQPDIDLLDAVADFRRWLAAQPVEPRTLDLVGHLETLANHFAGSFATPPAFDALWRFAHLERLPCMRRHTFDLLTPRTKTAWEKVAGKDRGRALNDEASRHFARVDHCYRVILGRIATALVAKLSDELDEVLADYAAFKRAAAVLDFDDLLERARKLVREYDAVRRALGRRYRHVFVDEFQDTDRSRRRSCSGSPRRTAHRGGRTAFRARAPSSWSATPSSPSTASAVPTLDPTARRAAPSRGAGRRTSCRLPRTSARARRS